MIEEDELLKILEKNKNIQLILDLAGSLGAPNWYLAAGCISQTVWNVNHGFDPENGIKDYDLIYCDADDITSESQEYFIEKGKDLFKGISVSVEIVNEARVHLWYKKHFGYEVNKDRYFSSEEAINAWPTTATAVGVMKNEKGEYKIYAPFGLDDLLGMVVRANKVKITEEYYNSKVDRWTKIWPKLSVVPW